ncbi:Redoxin [Suhomyces tanzawaensis NRRL Y-17324]|uniref:Redoxin n=1 Tax=Suhomyces tanzawaensis NRRL Y-17324 TaxID=984487 RepID=A0A1E4SQ68_9ASCO|nr:Redoxin [Suhomyces tanzawaensis NRRL Y-17324]ODV81577.1 Redoxin [Suhomyces tanzawaensis NRRL Y-17324]
MSSSGDTFPTDVKLQYVPYTKEHAEIVSSSKPVTLNLSELLPGKTVVFTSAIGAFTPPCTENHLPTYLNNVSKFKKKGVDRIVVLTINDPFVNSAWSKALGYKDEENYVIFATDPKAELSGKLGDNFVADLSSEGLGTRSSRYAAIVDDGHIVYLESEDGGAFTERSHASSLLERL